MSNRNDVVEHSVKLFEGEKWLVITGMLGFILAACIAVFIFFQGSIILPEGDLEMLFPLMRPSVYLSFP